MSKQLTILVTGASSGLGKQICDLLIASTKDHAVIQFDQTLGDDVRWPMMSAHWDEQVKELDVLINCAGVNSNQMFEDLTQEEYDRVMGINAYGIVAMTKTFLPQLKASKGTVINIVSNAAHMPMTSSLAYNASKAAALMITKQMAHELTPRHGITVFSVSPNKLEGTAMSKQIEDNVCKVRGWTPEFAKEYQSKALMHGLETPPVAVAEMIVHLIETGNMKYLSGTDLPFGK